MWRVINHVSLILYYSTLNSFHIMKPRHSVLFKMMPDLMRTELRTHFHKSVEQSSVPKCSCWSGELGFEAVIREEGLRERTQCVQFRTTCSELQSTGCPDSVRVEHSVIHTLKISECPKIGIRWHNANRRSKSD